MEKNRAVEMALAYRFKNECVMNSKRSQLMRLVGCIAFAGMAHGDVTWDGDAGDGLWATAANWSSDTLPAAGDTVNISNGDTVMGPNGNLPAGCTVMLSGSSDMTTDGTTALRLSGSTVDVASGSALTGHWWDLANGSLNFHDGAAATMNNWEHKGQTAFGFTLSETGFASLTPGTLWDAGTTWSDVTYHVDISDYDDTNGTTIVLVDWNSHRPAFNETFDPTVNIIATNGLGGALTFDAVLSRLVLTIDPPGNDAPVASDQTVSVTTNGPAAFTLIATDIEGSNLTYAIVDSPTNGSLSGSAPNLTYTATNSVYLFDTFTFTAFDGEDVSNTGTVTLAKIPYTDNELWATYHDAILNDPVNVEWLTSWTNGNIEICQIRYDLGPLTGTRTNASPKMAAYYAVPIGGTNLPGLVQIHGGGGRASADLAQFWAEQGYAAISINWSAGPLLYEPNTDWDGLPAGHFYPGTDFQNWTDPHSTETHASLYDVAHPLNSSWMLNAYAARRALTFLQSQSNVDGTKLGVTGHSMGGRTTVLTATDPRITCVTPSVGGTGFLYEDWWGVPGSGRSSGGTTHLEQYNQTVAAQSYWPDITCPTLFLTSANDFNAPFDLIIRAMALQSTNVPQRLAFTPHKNHQFDTESYAARVLWQRTHLADAFDFPERSVAQLDLTKEDGVPVFRVWPDESTSNTVVGVDIYYGIDREIFTRFWRDAPAAETNGYWEAPCPVFDLDEMMVVLAVVTYDLGFDLAMPPGYANPTRTFSVVSDVSLLYPPELENSGVVATAAKERLIDDFSRGFRDWITSNVGSANWSYFTRKLTDPSWRGPAGGELALEVVTTTAGNTLGLKLNTVRWNETSADTYKAFVPLPVAGSNSISVSVSDFTNDQSAGLTTWDDVTWLSLTPARTLNSGYPGWTGASPELANLRWVGGVYTFTNGVTSTWLEQYGLTLNGSTILADSDLDGMLNWEESVAGTNPTNDTSGLWFTGTGTVSNQPFIDWQAVSGKTYTVWFKTNLADAVWIEQGTGISGVEPDATSTIPTGHVTGFVHVQVEP